MYIINNKSIVLAFSIFGIVTLIITCIVVFLSINLDIFKSRKSYSEAEKYTINYLNSNIKELTELAKTVIKEKPDKGLNSTLKNIRKIYYDGDSFIPDGNYITFEFYDTGFYHDVDWGLIYSPSNNFAGEYELYTYDESVNDTKGNNVYVRKKLKDNWFFYYNDYDGDTNLNEITK